MKNPNLQQINFLLKNKPDVSLYKIIDENNFINIFLSHLTELFTEWEYAFSISEPFLDHSFTNEQSTLLYLNDIEIGDLFLFNNSFLPETSLVYYSPSGFLETNLLTLEDVKEMQVSDYIVFVYEFASLLLGQFILYKGKKNQVKN